MSKSLNGKYALVTGASGGIGSAVAKRLAGQGATVFAHCATQRDSAAAVVDEIRRSGASAYIIEADLTKPEKRDAISDQLNGFGCDRLDVLVNNAGVGRAIPFDATDPEEFDTLFDVNVKAVFFLTKALVPMLAEPSAIINISSMVSLVAYPQCMAYAMSKSALNSFTRSLAVELGPRGIRVNAIAPGATLTPFLGTMPDDPDIRSALEKASVFGRLGTPDDVADAAVFLSSTSGWITGQIMQASGGMHL